MSKTEGQKRTINGHEWEVFLLLPLPGIRIQARLAKMIGPAIRSGGDNIMDADATAIAGALLGNVDEDGVVKLIQDLMQGVYIDGKDMARQNNFDEFFRGNYSDLYAGIAFILEVNFNDLFQRGRSLFGKATAPEPSTGKSYREDSDKT